MIKRTIDWIDNKLFIVDQRKLPDNYEIISLSNYQEVADAIEKLAVRGAPAIGVAAAYGMALAAINSKAKVKSSFLNELMIAKKRLSNSRPTAVNLFWALDEIWRLVSSEDFSIEEMKENILLKANELAEEDIKTNYLIGENGSLLFQDGDTILTHCNAGSLATVFYGTALGVIRTAFKKYKDIRVFADETRPVLQGSRITAWELQAENIPVTLICDSAAGLLMYQKKIDKVIVGADRITANGDVVNKIGTYSLSVLAKVNNIPFFVAAPKSTVDFTIPKGRDVIIEEREPGEIAFIMGKKIAPDNVNIYNPAFDITPGKNVTAIITEKGIFRYPYKKSLTNLL